MVVLYGRDSIYIWVALTLELFELSRRHNPKVLPNSQRIEIYENKIARIRVVINVEYEARGGSLTMTLSP